MFFSKTTKYAVRSLVYISQKKEMVSLNELSENLDISFDYLKKILIRLNKAGMLESMKGKKGGYCLKKNPEDISIGDVVKTFEKMTLEECESKECKNKCGAYYGITTLEQRIMDILEDTSLKDFAGESNMKP
ncbi:MAG: Rrf2 family transcriptional regulator [Thermotogae bacterium]|nr:Rrf2 family transcriptional regulator [Thermotogota bacterium]